MIRWIITPLLCLLSLACCGNGNDAGGTSRRPALEMKIASTGGNHITLDIQWLNATHARVLCLPTKEAQGITVETVLGQGTQYADHRVTIEDLEPMIPYTVFATVCDEQGRHSALQSLQFTTTYSDPVPYAWESARDGILSYTDMVLCYGGSHHRTPYLWEADRFAPLVSYTDEAGKEHWLFDSFLFLESQDTNVPGRVDYTYMIGVLRDTGYSADREQWNYLIDYWFGADSGVNALEEAVAAAAQRLGTPPTKRKVVMVLPDPIYFLQYGDTSSTTVYWGEVNGRKLDFSNYEDRITAYKWYIDQVRARFDAADYQYIELAGFYIISEELAADPGDFNYQYKEADKIIPRVAEYLHALNESLNWVPYNRAAGYNRWKSLGIDYAFMQPNYYWEADKRPLSQFFSDIKAADLAMEFEFEHTVLESQAGSDVYRKRFREYMQGAIANGIYGSKPLAYYHGTNALVLLSQSQSAVDRELYHEFCQFVLNNPLRAENAGK